MKTLAPILLILLSQHISAQLTWNHLDGPNGSYVTFLYASDSFAYVTGPEFLYRSDDGHSWLKIGESVGGQWTTYKNQLLNIGKNAITGESTLRISDNFGINWSEREMPENIHHKNQIAVCSHGIYISPGHQKPIYRSTNEGITWDSITTPMPDAYDIYSFDEVIYTSTAGGELWKSNTSGAQWANISPSFGVDNESFRDIVAQGEHVIVATKYHLYTSHDGGVNWDKERMLHDVNSINSLVAIDNVIYLYSDKLWRSEDHGKSWFLLLDEAPYMLNSIGFKGQFFGSNSHKGIITWNDDENKLIQVNSGLSQGFVYSLAAQNNTIWAGCGNGLFKYNLDTKEWNKNRETTGFRNYYETVQSNDDGWIITKESRNIDYFLFSNNQGASWDSIYPSINNGNFSITNIALLDKNIIIKGYDGIYVSRDMGISWELSMLGLFTFEFDIVQFKNNYYIMLNGKIYKTEDHGITWIEFSGNTPVYDIAVSTDYLYAISHLNGTSAELQISSDGNSWINYQFDLPPISFPYQQQYHFFQDSSNTFMITPNEGLFASLDTFKTWKSVIPNLYGNTYLNYDNQVFLGFHGLYSTNLTNTYSATNEIIEYSNVSPLDISPNPSNGVFQIQSNYSFPSTRKLSVYNLEGKQMWSKMIDMSSGFYSIDLSQLPPTTYLMVLQMDKLVEQSTIMIMSEQ